MAKLKAAQRKKLPRSAFALPPDKYPINDASHARNALSRAAGNASPSAKAKIKAAVKRKFPKIKVGK